MKLLAAELVADTAMGEKDDEPSNSLPATDSQITRGPGKSFVSSPASSELDDGGGGGMARCVSALTDRTVNS